MLVTILATTVDITAAGVTASLAVGGAIIGGFGFYIRSSGTASLNKVKDEILGSINEKFSTKEVIDLRINGLGRDVNRMDDHYKKEVSRIDDSGERMKNKLADLERTDSNLAHRVAELERIIRAGNLK